MKPEELNQQNVGKPVLVHLNDNWNEARATLFGWSCDRLLAYVKLSSQYGKKWREGMTILVPANAVSLKKEEAS